MSLSCCFWIWLHGCWLDMLIDSKWTYLFNDTLINWDYKGLKLSGEMTSEQWTGNEIEGSGRGLICGTLSAIASSSWEESRQMYLYSRFRSQNFNLAPSECCALVHRNVKQGHTVWAYRSVVIVLTLRDVGTYFRHLRRFESLPSPHQDQTLQPNQPPVRWAPRLYQRE